MLMRTPTRWTKPTRRTPPGFILPAQPVLAPKPPVGPDWLYAVKHDGFRIVARKEGDGVHLWSRNGRDWSVEFSGITASLKAWKLKSLVLDGEACACDESGWPDFNALLGGGQACARCELSIGCSSGSGRGSWSCEASVIPRRTG
jgi:ATP-dependent DNA ligase